MNKRTSVLIKKACLKIPEEKRPRARRDVKRKWKALNKQERTAARKNPLLLLAKA